MTMAWRRATDITSKETAELRFGDFLIDKTVGENGYLIVTVPTNNNDIVQARRLRDVTDIVWEITATTSVLAHMPNGDFVSPSGRYAAATGNSVWTADMSVSPGDGRLIYDAQLDYILSLGGSNGDSITAYDPTDGSELAYGSQSPNEFADPNIFNTTNNRIFVSSRTSNDYARVEVFDITDGSHITSVDVNSQQFSTNAQGVTDGSYCYAFVKGSSSTIEFSKIDESGTIVDSTTLANNANEPVFNPGRSGDGSIYLAKDGTNGIALFSYNAGTLAEEWEYSLNSNPATTVADDAAAAVVGDDTAIKTISTTGNLRNEVPVDTLFATAIPTGELVVGLNGTAFNNNSPAVFDKTPSIQTIEQTGEPYETWADAKQRPHTDVNSRLRK